MINIQELWQKLKEPGLVEKLRNVGDILQYGIAWSAIVFVAFTGNSELAWLWLKVTLTTAVIVQMMKKIFNHTSWGTRPDGKDDSFPSGHTSGAFSGAWFYLFAFGWLAAIVPLFLACVTGMSRVLANRHWWRDVIASAIIALLVTILFF